MFGTLSYPGPPSLHDKNVQAVPHHSSVVSPWSIPSLANSTSVEEIHAPSCVRIAPYFVFRNLRRIRSPAPLVLFPFPAISVYFPRIRPRDREDGFVPGKPPLFTWTSYALSPFLPELVSLLWENSICLNRFCFSFSFPSAAVANACCGCFHFRSRFQSPLACSPCTHSPSPLALSFRRFWEIQQ